FEDDQGMRLSSWIESPGQPSDSLVASWVVLDSSRNEVARVRRVLTASACDISELRAADFNVTLPPGEYLSGLSVHGAGGLRGVSRSLGWIEPHDPTLEMRDLVITCGTPITEFDAAGAPSMRVAASPSAQISGSDPVTAYFEAYHLATTKDGRARL